MSFTFKEKLPTPDQIREEYPLDPDLAAVKSGRDEQIRRVFTGESDKFLVIIGPCSADNEDSVCDYVSRLARLQDCLLYTSALHFLLPQSDFFPVRYRSQKPDAP